MRTIRAISFHDIEQNRPLIIVSPNGIKLLFLPLKNYLIIIMSNEAYEIDQYNADNHMGKLPVRVLSFTYVEWFLKIYPSFIEEFETEVQLFALKDYITYTIDEKKIESVAELTPNKNITIFETYNQFLWNINYSLIVVYDEGFHKPSINKTFQGNIIPNNLIDEAITLFFYAMSLISEYSKWPNYNLPNPEKYSHKRKQYIENCNGSFVASMTFILLHEFAHQYYGHIDSYPKSNNESKQLELDADDFAFDYMSKQFAGPKGKTMQLGIITGLASLVLLDSSLRGGSEHPDPDFRLKRMIEKMELSDIDNIWGIASFAFILWGKYYSKVISLPKILEDSKTLFYKIIDKMSFLKLNG